MYLRPCATTGWHVHAVHDEQSPCPGEICTDAHTVAIIRDCLRRINLHESISSRAEANQVICLLYVTISDVTHAKSKADLLHQLGRGNLRFHM